MFSQITANVLATPQGTVTKPSVNLHFHRCHLDRTGYLSVPSGFVSTWLIFLSSPKLRASAHTVNRRELSYAVRALTCSLRTEKSIIEEQPRNHGHRTPHKVTMVLTKGRRHGGYHVGCGPPGQTGEGQFLYIYFRETFTSDLMKQ